MYLYELKQSRRITAYEGKVDELGFINIRSICVWRHKQEFEKKSHSFSSNTKRASALFLYFQKKVLKKLNISNISLIYQIIEVTRQITT